MQDLHNKLIVLVANTQTAPSKILEHCLRSDQVSQTIKTNHGFKVKFKKQTPCRTRRLTFFCSLFKADSTCYESPEDLKMHWQLLNICNASICFGCHLVSLNMLLTKRQFVPV